MAPLTKAELITRPHCLSDLHSTTTPRVGRAVSFGTVFDVEPYLEFQKGSQHGYATKIQRNLACGVVFSGSPSLWGGHTSQPCIAKCREV